MRFSQCVVKFQGSQGHGTRLGIDFAWGCIGVYVQHNVTVGQSSVSQRVARVLLDGQVEILNALLQVRLSSFVPEIDSSQVSLVGLRIDGTGTRQVGLLLRRQLDSDLMSNVASYVSLQG